MQALAYDWNIFLLEDRQAFYPGTGRHITAKNNLSTIFFGLTMTILRERNTSIVYEILSHCT